MPTRALPPGATSRDIADTVNQILDGKLNAQAEVTLRELFSTTVVTDPRCGPNSVILLSPLTANAADVLLTTYISARSNGSFTIHHEIPASANERFAYAILGG